MKLPEEMDKLDECDLIEAIVLYCAEIAYNFEGEQFVSPRAALRRAILTAFDLEEKK